MLNGHGDDLYLYPGLKLTNFSSNILGGVDHTALMKRLASAIQAPASYPEPDASSLARRLGPEGCVEVTAGATEAIYLLAQAHRGARSAILIPTFSEYADACRLHAHSVEFFHDLDQLPGLGCDMVWLCNPNNPTGRVIEHDRLLSLFSENGDKIFVVDQAYAPYTTLPTVTDREAIRAGNVVLLKSFTKRFSVPGLRIGHAVGAPGLIKSMHAVRMPWSVNALAIEGAHWLLDNAGGYVIDAGGLHREALFLSRELSNLGIATQPTDCNFILCRLPGPHTAARLKEYLAKEHAILIRSAANFHTLSPAHFRVAAQTRPENIRLVEAVKDFLAHAR